MHLPRCCCELTLLQLAVTLLAVTLLAVTKSTIAEAQYLLTKGVVDVVNARITLAAGVTTVRMVVLKDNLLEQINTVENPVAVFRTGVRVR